MELIRPRVWIKQNKIVANSPLPMNIPELEVSGIAFVHSVEDCPKIAQGDGSVITGRFITREVDVIVRAEIQGADETIEVVKGNGVFQMT